MIVKTVGFHKILFLLLICVFTSCINKKTQNKREVSSMGEPNQNDIYINPVLNTDFPDPAILKAVDGWYYAYATQSIVNGDNQNIQVARSKDLINWERMGDALPKTSLGQ